MWPPAAPPPGTAPVLLLWVLLAEVPRLTWSGSVCETTAQGSSWRLRLSEADTAGDQSTTAQVLLPQLKQYCFFQPLLRQCGFVFLLFLVFSSFFSFLLTCCTYRTFLLGLLLVCLFFQKPCTSWHLMQVCHQLSQLKTGKAHGECRKVSVLLLEFWRQVPIFPLHFQLTIALLALMFCSLLARNDPETSSAESDPGSSGGDGSLTAVSSNSNLTRFIFLAWEDFVALFLSISASVPTSCSSSSSLCRWLEGLWRRATLSEKEKAPDLVFFPLFEGSGRSSSSTGLVCQTQTKITVISHETIACCYDLHTCQIQSAKNQKQTNTNITA